MSDTITSWIYKFFKGKKAFLLFIVVLLFSASIWLASRLRFDEDIARLLPSGSNDNDELSLQDIIKEFNIADRIVVTVSLKSDSTEEQSTEQLIAAADSLVQKIQAGSSEYIKEIKSVIPQTTMLEVFDVIYRNLPVLLCDSDYIALEQITSPENISLTIENNYKTLVSPAGMVVKKYVIKDPLHLTNRVLSRMSNSFVSDNFIVYDEHILTKDKKKLVFFISSKYPASETGKNKELIEQLDKSVHWVADYSEHKIKAEYYGGVAAAVANADQIKKDIYLTISLAFLIIFLVLGLYYRSPAILLIIIPPVVFSGAMALGIMYLIKGSVSVISIAIGSVLLGIAVEFALHIYTHFKSKPDVKHVLKDLTFPISMAALTTASAFMCLYFVRSEAMHDLGLFASLSIIASALFSLLVLPHFLNPPKRSDKPGWFRVHLERFISYPFHQNKYLVAIVIILSFFFIVNPGHVTFEDDMYKLNYEPAELKQAGQNLEGISNFTQKSIYLISSGSTYDEALTKLTKANSVLQQLNEDSIISSYSNTSTLLISKEEQAKRIEQWNAFWTPDKKSEVIELIQKNGNKYKFNEKAFSGVETLINTEYQEMSMEDFELLRTTFYSDFTTTAGNKSYITTLVRVDHDKKYKVYDTFTGVDGIRFFDKGYIMHNLVQLLREDFNKLLAASMMIVFLIYLISFGRIELAILTFTPILLSWFWILGIMEITGAKFTIFNIIISTFIFGLGDDFSILTMQGLLQKHKHGNDDLPSYKISIFISAFIAMVGIGILIFAKHPALKSIALLSVIGIFTVVVLSYVLLPVLFRWVILNGRDKNILPVSISDMVLSAIFYILLLIGFLIIGTIRIIVSIIPVRYRKAIIGYAIFLWSRMLMASFFTMKVSVPEKNKAEIQKQVLMISNEGPFLNIILLLALKPGISILYRNSSHQLFFYKLLSLFGIAYNLDALNVKLKSAIVRRIKQDNSFGCFLPVSIDSGAMTSIFTEVINTDELRTLFVNFYGINECFEKGEVFMRKGAIRVRVEFIRKISELTESSNKVVYDYYRDDEIKNKLDLKKYLLKRYLFKGPVLEWYLRIKLRFEGYYDLFNRIIPEKCLIVDFGCGYGFMSHALAYYHPSRIIKGYDYDIEKIAVAQNTVSNNQSLTFIQSDITKVELSNPDIVIFSDVLHYLPSASRVQVLENVINSLTEGGKIIVRDGNTNMEQRHKGTWFTEFFATRIKFNKTMDGSNTLYFFSDSDILDIFRQYNLAVEIIDKGHLTSNIIYIGTKVV